MKNKGKKLAFLMALIFTVSLTACGKVESKRSNGETSANEKSKTVKKLVLGTCADYPPYEFHIMKDGKDEIVGFDIEIGKAIAKELGAELEIKDMDFKGLIPSLKTGKVDFILSGMTPTEERKKDVDFSDVYYKAVQSVIIKKDNIEKIKTLEDLKKSTIGVQKTSLQEEIAKDQIKATDIKSLGKITDLILSLKSDKVQAVIVENPVAKAYVDKNKDLTIANIKIGEEDGGSAIAVNKGNEKLLKAINSVLKQLIKDNKIDEFVTKSSELIEK